MTQITPSHRLANRATLAVSTVLARAGALAEQIKNDYGEDLFVQTQLDDEADHFRILIQVKGTTLKSGSNKYHSFRMDVPHLQRWVGHIEPILVCVYDDGSDKIYAFSPNERFSLWELCTTEKKTLTTKLSEDDVFDEFTAKRFIWKCRLMHFSRMLAWYENSYNYAEYHEHLDRSGSMNFREGNVVVISFLKSLGLLREDHFDVEWRKSIDVASRNLSVSKSDRAEPEMTLRSVFMLCLLGRIDDICSVGLPANLMEHGTEMCGLFFKMYHPNEWRKAGQLFRGEPWRPYGTEKPKPRKKSRPK